jgi:hypothetical protein
MTDKNCPFFLLRLLSMAAAAAIRMSTNSIPQLVLSIGNMGCIVKFIKCSVCKYMFHRFHPAPKRWPRETAQLAAYQLIWNVQTDKFTMKKITPKTTTSIYDTLESLFEFIAFPSPARSNSFTSKNSTILVRSRRITVISADIFFHKRDRGGRITQ